MSKKESKAGKYSSGKGRKRFGLVLLVIALIAVAAVAGLAYIGGFWDEEPSGMNPDATDFEETGSETTEALQENNALMNLNYGIYVTDIGKYTGVFMEDGSDEILSNVLMMVVQNNGSHDIQYAEISADVNGETAQFVLTTLPVGKKMVLLEKNRMQWNAEVDYTVIPAGANNVAYFQTELTDHSESLEISLEDGMVNVKNISGKDIPGAITVYYKNAADDLYYGGITYRFSIEDGLAAGEIRQVMTNHASRTGTEIAFVTIAQ